MQLLLHAHSCILSTIIITQQFTARLFVLPPIIIYTALTPTFPRNFSGENVLDALKRLGESGRTNPTTPTKSLTRQQQWQAKKRTVPEENRLEFEHLTEDANNLMAHGWFGIYVETKEQLQRKLRVRGMNMCCIYDWHVLQLLL